MNRRYQILLALIGIMALTAGLAAWRMISATAAMNTAARYAADHLDEVPPPQPLPGSAPLAEPPVMVEAVARYAEANAVEVQITRRYRTARHPEALFTVTYFYQPNAGGWQSVPAPASFWGETKETRGSALAVTHPQRSQKLMDNLIKFADPALTAACQRWQCPAGTLPLQLAFVTHPDGVSGPRTYLTPQLTGVPRSREANEDYLSALTAAALLDLANQLGQPAEAAYAEIERQNLYPPLTTEY